MSYTYSSWIAALSNETAIPATDTNFVAIVPTIIDYAEQRIYRELDLLSTIVRDSSSRVTANTRLFTLPQSLGRFVTTQGINIYTPAGMTTTRNQVTPVSRDYVDATWTTDIAASASTVPEVYAMITDQTVIFGPPPGASFYAEVIGTIRPTPLSASNTTTYLTLYLPDLWFAATMVGISGYMRNFGSQSDNPQMAVSWEAQYQTLKGSALIEEVRKKYQAQAWGSQSPSPIASPER